MALQLPEIVSLASAYYGSAVLFAALELDLFTQLKRTPHASASALAQRLGADERGLTLLLDAAVAVGLLTKAEGCFDLTEAAASSLVQGAEHDLTRAIAYNRGVYPAWGRLAELARTGRPVEAPALHLGEDPDRTRTFALSMYGRAMGIGRAVVPALQLPAGAKVLDLAGGPGAYALLMAQSAPEITVDTYDLPAISAVARELTAPCAGRVRCFAGDYHVDRYPEAAYDAVTLFGCLHQEAPEMIRDILRRAVGALKPGGRLYVLDMMTGPDHTTPPFSALFAVNMALTTEHGWVFSTAELDGWMAEAGLEARTFAPVPPPMPHTLAQGRKPACAARA